MKDVAFDIYEYDKLTGSIEVRADEVVYKSYTDDVLLAPFGVRKNITTKEVEEFLERRCFPRERANARELLNNLELDIYDPLEICKITKGRMYHSTMYLNFK